MRTLQRIAQQWVACAIALAIVGLATHATAQPVQVNAQVLRVKGSARYSTDNRTWQTLHKGDILKPGTTIQTAEKSTVDIMLGARESKSRSMSPIAYNGVSYNPEEPSANVVRVMESSVLAIDKLTSEETGNDTVEETQLDLRAGRIMGNVKKMSASSKYEIKIPNGVAGIRGTIYIIDSSGVVNVLAGSLVIAVVGPDGNVVTKVVTAGWRYDPMSGALTQIPSAELPNLWAEVHTLTPPNGGTIVTTPTDTTILHVTPVNQNGQGQNGNGQGQNQGPQ